MLTGPQKAFATMLITLLGGSAEVVVLQLPDNPTVKLWGGIVVGVTTLVANTLGVYFTPNSTGAKADPAAGLEGP